MNEIDNYIAQFSPEIQLILQEIREIIQEVLPEAKEVISYKMPAYKMNGILVYFAGYSGHIGFYPTAVGIENFNSEFGDYKWSKGAVQFPHQKNWQIKNKSKFNVPQNEFIDTLPKYLIFSESYNSNRIFVSINTLKINQNNKYR
jgi:uncharacterized protein YdhG (YjbR/CyaY superfamily)